MNKKSLIAIITVLSVLNMFVGTEIFATDTATVAATVTVQNISVSVADGTVAYGTLALNASTSTCDLTDTQIITNGGNVAETFNVKGSTSTNWTLGAAAGSETYVHKMATSTCPVTWTSGTALTLSYLTAVTNVAANATSTLNLQVATPTATTHFTEQSFNVTVQAIAF